MRRNPLILAQLGLAACVTANPETEGGIVETPEYLEIADSMAIEAICK